MELISDQPDVLKLNVEEDLVPLCTFLKDYLDERAMGALIRHPQLALVPIMELKASVRSLLDHGLKKVDISSILWRNPSILFDSTGVKLDACGENRP